MIDRDRFFAAARARPFGGSMTAGQIAGVNAILNGWEARPELTDLRWLAYMLATAKLETGHTMQPVHEYGGKAYLHRMYDIEGKRPDKARELGNLDPGDGVKYAGRGYVQLTGKNNYRRMAQLTGLDLVANPDAAMQPEAAARIMFEGMKGGLFTGVGLPKYFNATTDDPVNARRVINGTDKAGDIAAIHRDFLAALIGSSTGTVGAGGSLAGSGGGNRAVLKRGSKGQAVVELQRALGITPDGDFGPQTEAGVRLFQEDQGLVADGVVGARTWAALAAVAKA